MVDAVQRAVDKVLGKVYVGHGHIALAGVHVQQGVAALALSLIHI